MLIAPVHALTVVSFISYNGFIPLNIACLQLTPSLDPKYLVVAIHDTPKA